uniref:Dynein heavy chain coiled coil stalk domain-containing protein n=1 Tax=Panagrolaimus davidi TaxID=227884 RepID=A0A914PU74_9BILA
MLPATIFTPQLLSELKSNCQFEESKNQNEDFIEWRQKEAITKSIRQNLHVIFRVERATIEKYQKQFQQISNYSLACLLKWKESELLSFAELTLQKSLLFVSDEVTKFAQKLYYLFKFAQKQISNLQTLSFLDFAKQYIHLVKEKKSSIELLDKRYKTGISKLEKANEQVNFLQQELLRLQPELVRTSLETTVLMSTIERETIEIENAREVVAANEFKANEAATKAQSLKAECEREVAEAIPALEAAIDALQVLNQTDISLLKTIRVPPNGVRLLTKEK